MKRFSDRAKLSTRVHRAAKLFQGVDGRSRNRPIGLHIRREVSRIGARYVPCANDASATPRGRVTIPRTPTNKAIFAWRRVISSLPVRYVGGGYPPLGICHLDVGFQTTQARARFDTSVARAS